jgi:glycosyltransferase involved in cell wall biosynthesis
VSRFAPWRLLDLDLEEMAGLGDLPAELGLGGYRATVWWRELPLGHVDVSAARLPMPASQLRDLALQAAAPAVACRLLGRPLDAASRLSGELSGEEMPADPARLSVLVGEAPLARLGRMREAERRGPDGRARRTVSVVVCTRDRPRDLERCLASLRRSAVPPHEVVVVDNAPGSPATRAVTDRHPEVRRVAEPEPGLSVARNTGIRHATGELIAFTDDDVAVHPDWLGRIEEAFADPRVMAVTGLVLPAELETEAQWIFEQSFSFSQGYRPLLFDDRFFARTLPAGVPAWSLGAGANMAFRRQGFDALGGFDVRLGAGAAGCSEDSELWYRLLAAGQVCLYEPAAVVRHFHRPDADGLRRQMRAYQRGHVTALLVQLERHGHPGNLRRLLVTIPRYYAKLLLLGLLHGWKPRHRTLPAEMAGCMAGVWYYLRHRGEPSGSRGRCGARAGMHKEEYRAFLARNPFGHPLTLGFFYREKMRAIHTVAPDAPFRDVLEVGGGQGGLTHLLYPRARIVNLDFDPHYGRSPVNRRKGIGFVCGDSTALPFPDGSFDAVTMFDLLEHVPDDRRAAAEALRVLRPGGALLVSSPNESWRFPYYGALKPLCPTEEEMFAEWGHVRRGYGLAELEELIGLPCERRATFISPVTVVNHDFAFSRLPRPVRRAICAALSPVTWLGWWLHRPDGPGTETAAAWHKP